MESPKSPVKQTANLALRRGHRRNSSIKTIGTLPEGSIDPLSPLITSPTAKKAGVNISAKASRQRRRASVIQRSQDENGDDSDGYVPTPGYTVNGLSSKLSILAVDDRVEKKPSSSSPAVFVPFVDDPITTTTTNSGAGTSGTTSNPLNFSYATAVKGNSQSDTTPKA